MVDVSDDGYVANLLDHRDGEAARWLEKAGHYNRNLARLRALEQGGALIARNDSRRKEKTARTG
jgi:hypothetical protein